MEAIAVPGAESARMDPRGVSNPLRFGAARGGDALRFGARQFESRFGPDSRLFGARMVGEAPGNVPGLISAVSRLLTFLLTLDTGGRGEAIACAVS